jgi:hypothetical protein
LEEGTGIVDEAGYFKGVRLRLEGIFVGNAATKRFFSQMAKLVVLTAFFIILSGPSQRVSWLVDQAQTWSSTGRSIVSIFVHIGD